MELKTELRKVTDDTVKAVVEEEITFTTLSQGLILNYKNPFNSVKSVPV